jgi:hypothetical protein
LARIDVRYRLVLAKREDYFVGMPFEGARNDGFAHTHTQRNKP